MGIEMIIALAALGISLVALVQVRDHIRKTLNTATKLKNEQSALTEELSGRLKRIGDRFGETLEGPDAVELRRVASTVRALELRVEEHDMLLCSLVTEDEARHLWNVSTAKDTLYLLHHSTEHELRSLVRRGLLEKKSDFKIHELSQQFDLHEFFELTEIGQQLLSLRKHLRAADTRAVHSLPPSRGASPAEGQAPESAPVLIHQPKAV